MADFGYFTLVSAFAIAIYSGVVAVLGARQGREDLIRSAERGVYGLLFLLAVTSAALIYLLVTRDFQVKYVANYTSQHLPTFYAISAFWAGQDGSLLFWAMVLSAYAAAAVYLNRNRHRELMPYVIATIAGVSLFFLSLMLFVANPFEKLPFRPVDGQGLNPLLQNPYMTCHPPSLYLGYIGFAIPFAFAIAALITKRLGNEWITTTRRWVLFPWLFLTLGNILGAHWAYLELGWGGYWAWDPVENAAFMPWLTGTAFLHSVMIQEKRGMLKLWNMVLIILTFCLTIFGTFLTRSGIISSVHSFTQSGIGGFFVAFLAIVMTGSFWLLYRCRAYLRTEHQLESFVSRESSFLYNNLLLVGMAFTVLWGTIFPVISEAVRGVKITVGPPFFNQVNVPTGLALLLLTGIGPLIAWRKASLVNLRSTFAYPLGAGVLTALVLIAFGMRHFYALMSYGFCALVLSTIVIEYYRGTMARHRYAGETIPQALAHLVARNRRRYGGYIVHLGIVMIFVGITGSSAFQQEALKTLKKGEMMPVGRRYALVYESLDQYPVPGKFIVSAILSVYHDGKKIGTIRPERHFYGEPPRYDQNPPSTETAIRSTLKEDLYVVLADFAEDGSSATFKAYINPLVMWIWIGGTVMALGTIIAMWPEARERRRKLIRVQEVKRVSAYDYPEVKKA